MNTVIHTKENGIMILTETDILKNALQQKRQGIKPHYCYNFGKGELSRPGFLVYSTFSDGAGVYVLNADETGGILIKGWKGEFQYI